MELFRRLAMILLWINIIPIVLSNDSMPFLHNHPIMGWSTWTVFWCHEEQINEASLLAQAQKLIDTGLAAKGYIYINIDDCWTTKLDKERPASDHLVPAPDRFSNGMKHLSDTLAKQGLLLGMYSDVGDKTCMGYPGSKDHEEMDAKDMVENWNVRYIKLDGCYASTDQYRELYTKWGEVTKVYKSGSQHVHLNCSWPAYTNSEEIEHFDFTYLSRFCDSWRIYGDISPSWKSILSIMKYWGDHGKFLSFVTSTGSVNDPDTIQIGNGISLAEGRTQMSIWSIVNGPLIIGSDVTKLSHDEIKILGNDDVLRISKDILSIAGLRIWEHTIPVVNAEVSLWLRVLHDGTMAVAMVNQSDVIIPYIALDFADIHMGYHAWKELYHTHIARHSTLYNISYDNPFPIGLNEKTIGSHIHCDVKNVWEGKDMGRFENSFPYKRAIHAHDTVLLLLSNCHQITNRVEYLFETGELRR